MSIEFETLYHESLEQTFLLATEVFVANSTLHSALGIRLDEYRDYLRKSFVEIVEESLSVVAVDTDSDKLVGCIIASDFYHHLDAPITSNEKFAPIGALGKALAARYLEFRKIEKGEVVLSDMAAIAPNMLGKNIYQQMKAFCHENARTKGFNRIVGELSSEATQHVVLTKLGHQKIAEIKFSDFEFKGRRHFASIKEPDSIILAEGEL